MSGKRGRCTLCTINKEDIKTMKQIKKLASLLLAAVLAMTLLAGCGSSSSLTDQVKGVLADNYAVSDVELTYSKELDALAAKLMAEADKAATKAENKDKTVLELLTDEEVVKAAGIDTTKGTYVVSAAENYELASNTLNKQKAVWIATVLMSNYKEIGSGSLQELGDCGLVMGKINGKEYFVWLLH